MLLRQLEYLVALARTRHFARAAEACYISQPALSAAIRNLESELLVQDVDAMRDSLTGCLRIGAIPTALSSISSLTTPFAKKYPLTQVSIKSLTSAEIQRGLDEYELDVGLTYIDNEPLANVRKTPLYRERYLLVTFADERFAHRESATWTEAARVPLCLLTPDMQNRRIINEAFRQAGAEPSATVETNSVTALVSHIRHGGWSAVIAQAWLYQIRVPQGMLALPLVEPDVTKGVGLVVQDRDPEPILARALIDMAMTINIQQQLEARD